MFVLQDFSSLWLRTTVICYLSFFCRFSVVFKAAKSELSQCVFVLQDFSSLWLRTTVICYLSFFCRFSVVFKAAKSELSQCVFFFLILFF